MLVRIATTSSAASRTVLAATARGRCAAPATLGGASQALTAQQLQQHQQQQVRFHHPDPFNPKVTKGWKAALKVCAYGP